MLHPVGTQSSGTYWRRRVLLIGAPVVLILVTLWVTVGDRSDSKQAARTTTPSSPHTAPVVSTSAPKPSTSPAASSSTAPSTSASAPAGATPAACTASQLRISAATGANSYKVGDSPVLMLQVVNAGSADCTQDLSDSQVELRVYNGESRVWGSHDCKIEPGTAVRTLPVGQTVQISVTWTGLSSQPGCAGTRQRVGAGTYTLYPYLSGRVGTVAQFSIT